MFKDFSDFIMLHKTIHDFNQSRTVIKSFPSLLRVLQYFMSHGKTGIYK